MKLHPLNVILIVAGAICEILGLLWLAANVSRERVGLGDAGFLRRIWIWLTYWLGPMPESQDISITAASAVSVSGSVSVARLNETEIERVQREVRELRERLDRFQTQVQGRLAAVEQSLHEKHELLTARVSEIETSLREARRADLRQTRWAGRLFALGAALSATGSLI
jgi:hypothetical protein